MSENSRLLGLLTGLLYPAMLLFAVHIMINGAHSPGGGFQGGALLASVFISRYLVTPLSALRMDILQKAEKLFFLCIILLPLLVLLRTIRPPDIIMAWYLVAMNILIGLKVCCGLTIIFYRFVFHEEDCHVSA